MRHPLHNPALPRGFTLVELVLVLLIVAVLSAIAIPRFAQASARQRLEAAADRVASDIELARTRARAASQGTSITFNTADGSYALNAVGGDAVTVQLDESPYQANIVSADFGGSPMAVFNAFGVPAAAGSVVVSANGTLVTIELDASGGVKR